MSILRCFPVDLPKGVLRSGLVPALLVCAVVWGKPALGSAPDEPSRTLAILEVQEAESGLSDAQLDAISDWVRGAARTILPHLTVMTRENQAVLLEANERAIETCVHDCEVQIGRMLGADYMVTGSVTRFGGLLVLTLRMHDTARAAFLGQARGRAASEEELIEAVEDAGDTLFAPLAVAAPGRPAPAAPGPLAERRPLPAIRAETGRLLVEGEPVGARLEVSGPPDYGRRGQYSTTLPYGPEEVPSGTYLLEISADDYETREKAVAVHSDRTALVEIELVRSEGVLKLSGSPSGARVEVSCRDDFGETFGLPSEPYALLVPRGRCTIKVGRSGYEPAERTVQVPGGEEVSVRFALEHTAEDPAPVVAREAPARERRALSERLFHLGLSLSSGVFVPSDRSSTGRASVGLHLTPSFRWHFFMLDLGLGALVEGPGAFVLQPAGRFYLGPVFARVGGRLTAGDGAALPSFMTGLGVQLGRGGGFHLPVGADLHVYPGAHLAVDFSLGLAYAF